VSIELNRVVVRRWYDMMWNQWCFALVDELVSEDLVFQGSLGKTVRGRDGLRRYMEEVHAAFPDFHNRIDALVADGDRVAARLTYTGTHRGPVLGIAPTGRRIEYVGAAFFRLIGGLVTAGWVLGDTAGLRAQLAAQER
jgi:steroid delta-isomerase-like uncharacterized protein